MARLDDEQDFDERRLKRRARRKKSQLTAITVLVIFILIIMLAVIGGIFGVKKLLLKAPKKAEEAVTSEASLEASEPAVIETPEEEPEVEELSEDDILNEIVDTCISEMPIEDKVAGLFIVSPEQLTGVETAVKAGSGTQEALTEYAVGGVLYSAKNIKSEDQIKEMLSSTTSMSKYPLFTVVREDGSKSSAVTSSLGAGETEGITDPETASDASDKLGSRLFDLGFNVDLAPYVVLDRGEEENLDPETVKAVNSAVSKGLSAAGVMACAGRFPLDADTLAGMAKSDLSYDDLATGEYEMFKGLIDSGDIQAVMMSNISLPEVTSDNTPASLSSKVVTESLRETLGFDGIVITAPLNEGAVTEYYTSEEAAVEAVRAGADMLLVPEDFKAAYEGLLTAVSDGRITEDRINESLKRIYAIKYSDRASQVSGS
ncbi:MAG: beta-N-acetylhexosaminidase [Butyrivibrio sp.]|nr:beta-N-acetylhexosaminidase [Butyrivibrio sp.]